MFASDIAGGRGCDCGARNFKKDREHRDREGEITHWDAHCGACGKKEVIFND